MNLKIEEGTYFIEDIQFIYSSGVEKKVNVSSCWLTVYEEEENQINIIESPTSFVNVEKSNFLIVDYVILSANDKTKEELPVLLELPSELEQWISVSIMQIEEDVNMTETAYDLLYFDLPIEQRELLKAYKVTTSLTKNAEKGFIIQLLFKTNIFDENQYMGAFLPLVIS